MRKHVRARKARLAGGPSAGAADNCPEGTTGCGLLPPGCLNPTGTLWAGSVALGWQGSPANGGRLCRRRRASTRVFRTKSASLWSSSGDPVCWEPGGHADAQRAGSRAQKCPPASVPGPHAAPVAGCKSTSAPRGQGVLVGSLEPQRVAGVCWGLNQRWDELQGEHPPDTLLHLRSVLS